MKKRYSQIFVFALICLMFLLQTNSAYSSPKKSKKSSPILEVKIKPEKSKYAQNEDIRFTMTLTNKSKTVQTVTYNKLSGLHADFAKVIDMKTGVSMCDSSGIPYSILISSRRHSKEEIKNNEVIVNLKPGETVNSTFSILDVTYFINMPDKLEPGKYRIKLYFFSNESNEVQVEVE